MFGGVQGVEDPIYLNDTWSWDGSTWTQQLPLRSPSPRCCTGVAYDAVHRRVVLFGGETAPGIVAGGTWTWNGTNWSKIVPGQSPSSREVPGMTYDSTRHQVVLFGGFTGGGDGSDTWTWDGATWTCRAGCP
jgi:hypothetical protein